MKKMLFAALAALVPATVIVLARASETDELKRRIRAARGIR